MLLPIFMCSTPRQLGCFALIICFLLRLPLFETRICSVPFLLFPQGRAQLRWRDVHGRGLRRRGRRMLRGNTRGSQLLSDFDGAIADFDDVIEEEPEFTRAYMEKAKILRRARKPQEADPTR